MKKLLLLLVVLAGLAACNSDDDTFTDLDIALERAMIEAAPPGEGLSFYRLPDSDDYASIPQDPRNPITKAKVDLGEELYHETALATKPLDASGLMTYSCASCHHAKAGFQAGRAQGIGDGGLGFGLRGEGRHPNSRYELDSLDVQPIRSPSILNAAYQEVQLWNGQFGALGLNEGTEDSWEEGTPKFTNYLGYTGVETQAIAGLTVHRMDVDSIQTSNAYQGYFAAAFPQLPPEERFTKEAVGLAIAAYERTVLPNRAPYQRWLKGERSAMTDREKEGALLFFGKGQCASCHTGPALNSMEFYALGMRDLDGSGIYGTSPDASENKGRGGFTGRPEDMYKFKVPQLYNLKDSPFYGHGATFTSLRDVLEYKNDAIKENPDVPDVQLAEEFIPLGLTDEEIDKILEFLENALHDPELDRYEPDALPSGFCFPNNDAESRVDLGCD